MNGVLIDDRECSKCGTLLGEDEGICPTCGTVFGRATVAMPAVSRTSGSSNSPGSPSALPDGLDIPSAPPAAQNPFAPQVHAGMGQKAEGDPNNILWVVAGLIALIAVVLIAITISIVVS
ncbi:MAG: hypothetical protein AAFS10_19630 [Myxococcota bacterium]